MEIVGFLLIRLMFYCKSILPGFKLHCSPYFSTKSNTYICVIFYQAGHGSDAIKSCTELLEMDPESLDGLCDRAEAHIANENYDEGGSWFVNS